MNLMTSPQHDYSSLIIRLYLKSHVAEKQWNCLNT